MSLQRILAYPPKVASELPEKWLIMRKIEIKIAYLDSLPGIKDESRPKTKITDQIHAMTRSGRAQNSRVDNTSGNRAGRADNIQKTRGSGNLTQSRTLRTI